MIVAKLYSTTTSSTWCLIYTLCSKCARPLTKDQLQRLGGGEPYASSVTGPHLGGVDEHHVIISCSSQIFPTRCESVGVVQSVFNEVLGVNVTCPCSLMTLTVLSIRKEVSSLHFILYF